MYPPEKPLTETAHDRLSALAANNDLGAGMAIAMKDLEIRGAGNLLGDEQSGHIADVGFDLYIRMVGEAIAEYRGEQAGEETAEMRIELPVDAHLPTDYVESERLRLEMYRRLAEVRDLDDIAQVRAGDDAAHAEWIAIDRLASMEDAFFEDHFHMLDHFLQLAAKNSRTRTC